jgi:hypothetical protein
VSQDEDGTTGSKAAIEVIDDEELAKAVAE